MKIGRIIQLLLLVILTSVKSFSATGVTLALPQTGWPCKANKVFALAASEMIAAPTFSIYSGESLVMRASMSYQGIYWNMYQYTADISSITRSGFYKLVIDNYIESTFIISDFVFKQIPGNSTFVTIPDIINTLWHFQRCTPAKCFTPIWNFGGYYLHVNDSGLPLYELKGTAKNLLPGSSKELYGGWHDAVSTDKESPNIALSIMNMCHAIEKIKDTADRNALMDEMKWGLDYLLKVQNEDGSFPACIWPCFTWENPVLPRHVEINKATGIVARCAASLALASAILKNTDSILAYKSITAALNAWIWVEQNPDHFETGNLPSWRTGSASTVLYAAVELARATGNQRFFNYADSIILLGAFYNLGYWAKDSTLPGSKKFNGQLENPWIANMNEVSYGQAPVALARYYNTTRNNTVKIRIKNLCSDYVHKIETNSNNPYRICESQFESWWGFMPNNADLAKCLLHIGLELNDSEAIKLALKQYEWLVGCNPLGGSGIIGFGNNQIIQTEACERTPEKTIGGLLPGMILLNGQLSTYYAQYNQWSICEVGESSSVIFDLLAGFNLIFNPTDSLSDLPDSIHSITQSMTKTLNIFPNPANDLLNLNYKSYAGENVQLIIYSLDAISSKIINLQQAEGTYSLDVSGFTPGFYLISMRIHGQDILHKSLVILR